MGGGGVMAEIVMCMMMRFAITLSASWQEKARLKWKNREHNRLFTKDKTTQDCELLVSWHFEPSQTLYKMI